MDIDKFSFGYCEACIENDKQTKICLSCLKQIIYCATRQGCADGLVHSMPDSKEITELAEKLCDKLEFVGQQLDELGIEINKHRLHSHI